MLKLIMTKYRGTKFILSVILFVVFLSVSCSFSVTPVYNSKNETHSEINKVKDVNNRDDLKVKAIEKVNQLHKLMEERKFEEAYQMALNGEIKDALSVASIFKVKLMMLNGEL